MPGLMYIYCLRSDYGGLDQWKKILHVQLVAHLLWYSLRGLMWENAVHNQVQFYMQVQQ